MEVKENIKLYNVYCQKNTFVTFLTLYGIITMRLIIRFVFTGASSGSPS